MNVYVITGFHRWFALLEIQLIVAMIIYKFDIKLLEKVPDNVSGYIL